MVKVSRKYASTGGCGFAQFDDGKPASEVVHNTCFSCHAIVKARDFIFNRMQLEGRTWESMRKPRHE